MGQERQFGSVKPLNTADDRRVLAAVAAPGAVPTLPPPKQSQTPQVGSHATGTRVLNFRVLSKITATNTATIRIWGWSGISEEWHTVGDFAVDDKNPISQLYLNSYEGLYLQVTAISGGTLDAWVLTEHVQETLGAASGG